MALPPAELVVIVGEDSRRPPVRLSRGSTSADDPLAGEFRLGEVTVDAAGGRIIRPDGEIRVEPRAMAVLMVLARASGRPVSRDTLIDAVWKHSYVTDESLSRCISLLRSALGDTPVQPRYLQTLPKLGYRLLVPPQPVVVAGPQTASVLVLPLLNLCGHASDEHLADGLTELLIANLAIVPRLSVISRTSAMHYKGTRAKLTDIARELAVDYVVEGSLLRSDSELQVVVQLIDPTTDRHLYARTYRRAFADALRLLNEAAWCLAEEIAARIEPDATRPEPTARRPAPPPLNEDAMRAFMLARHFWAQRTPDGFARAVREYETCLAVEPAFAPARAGIADTLLTSALYGLRPPAEVAARARAEAARALADAPDSAEAVGAAGGVALFFDWNLPRAAELFRRALALNPSHDMARLGLADALAFGGDIDGGLREMYLAVQAGPFDLGLQMNLGDFLLWARRYDEAIAQFRRTLELGPHFVLARCLLAETLALMGRPEAARAELRLAAAYLPPTRLARARAFVEAVLGDRTQAQEALALLEAERRDRYLPASEFARVYAALGDANAAFEWIDRAIEERTPRMLQLGIGPAYDRIRDDPRFAARLERIGLPG
jgi:TolB-like protein/DNA-binding winged helix-turn-helix (wHTH) protein/Tfp pilus assembly protein PilF